MQHIERGKGREEEEERIIQKLRVIPYPIPLRFQLKNEEEDGDLCVLCIGREKAAKMREKRERVQLK